MPLQYLALIYRSSACSELCSRAFLASSLAFDAVVFSVNLFNRSATSEERPGGAELVEWLQDCYFYMQLICWFIPTALMLENAQAGKTVHDSAETSGNKYDLESGKVKKARIQLWKGY